MSSWAFYVLGTPGPQGSKRHVGAGRMIEQNKTVTPWREAVVASAPTVERALDGPLAVKMVFTLQRPKGAPKRLVRPATTPDLDKLARSTADALKTAGLIADDARLCEYVRLAKVWTGYDPDALPVPGAVVACCEIDAIDPDNLDGHASPDEWLWFPFQQARAEAWKRIRGVA